MRTYLLNPTLAKEAKYIREGRCMQKAASWATAWPPITLATLGALAKRHGEVRLLDGNVESYTLQDVIEDVRKHSSDLVLVNTGFPSIEMDMAVAGAVKKALPNVRVGAFGVYFTLLGAEGMREYPFLDFAILGEPEETFEEVVKAMAAGAVDYRRIPGLAFWEEGRVEKSPPRALIKDLDTLPFPDRELLPNDLYRLPHNDKPYTLINTGRGCPHQCTFCIVLPYYGRTVRRHSLDYILREIRECIDKYGIREFLFWEEVFTLDKKQVLAFCRALEELGLKIRWAATTRVTSIDEEVLVAMKKAGCYLLGMGVESSSQEILDNVMKKQTVADVRRAVAACKKVGISTMGHCIFGLPGETPQTAEATIRFMVGLGLDYMQCYCAVPYPGTALGELARARGWIQAKKWSQYDFGGDSVMNTDALRAEEVTAFRTKAFRRFYLRPAYLIKTVLGSFSLRRLLRLAAFSDWMVLFRKKGSA